MHLILRAALQQAETDTVKSTLHGSEGQLKVSFGVEVLNVGSMISTSLVPSLKRIVQTTILLRSWYVSLIVSLIH